MSRRGLAGAFLAAAAPLPPLPTSAEEEQGDSDQYVLTYDENGVILGSKDSFKAELQVKVVELEGGASYKVPAVWKASPSLPRKVEAPCLLHEWLRLSSVSLPAKVAPGTTPSMGHRWRR